MAQHILTLIRHGQCAQEGDDPPLTALGHQQAAVTADALQELDIDTIYHSTLRRARETAEIIAHSFPNARIIGDDRLREGIPTIPPKFRTLFETLARDNPDFGSAEAMRVQARLDLAGERIFTPTPDRDIHDLVIGHGNSLRYLVCRALGLDIHAWVQLHPPANCSLTRIIIAPDAVKEALDAGITLTTLYAYNETAHLPVTMRTLK